MANRKVDLAKMTWGDNELISLMDMHENQGLTFAAIAKKTGRTRLACSSAYRRIINELAKSEGA